jgi:hypothetical protein
VHGGAAALALALSLSCTGKIDGGAVGTTGGPGNPATGSPGAPGSSGSTGTPGGAGTSGGAAGVPGTSEKPVDVPVTGPIVSAPGASTRFARLNHAQWENTVRDLLRLPAASGLSSTFIAEPLRSSFDTNGGLLTVDQDLWSDYQRAAESLAQRVAHDPKLLAALVPAGAPTDVAGKGKAFIQAFGARAFRRPLAQADVDHYTALFAKGPMLFGTADPFIDGVELVITAMLQSPGFLYRGELGTNVVNGRIALDGYEIATRLAYGLTNTMPDDALFAAAGAGTLGTRDGVRAQATRLLATPAAQQMVADFHDQLLHMRDFDGVKKDAKTAPLFDGAAADLKTEAKTFVNDIIFTQGRGVTELLTAPYTFGNSRIKQLYGLPATTPKAGTPDPFARIDLDPTQRAGLLTQLGFLSTNAEGGTPNIIIRGVRLARDVLCLNLPPPPDNVPPLPALQPNTTNRQRVAELTKDAPCNVCHTNVINPLGYAFENLDGLGKWRTTDNSLPVDATGTYKLDGATVTFDGPVSFIKAIASTRQAHDCYSRHLVEYIYGRDADLSTDADANLIASAGARSKAAMSVKDLILELVTTDSFVTRTP